MEGNGTYNLKTQNFLGNLDGTNFELAHFPQPKDPRLSVAGALKFDAHASGTIDAPSVLAGIHLRNLVMGGQPAGALEVVVHTQGTLHISPPRTVWRRRSFRSKAKPSCMATFRPRPTWC